MCKKVAHNNILSWVGRCVSIFMHRSEEEELVAITSHHMATMLLHSAARHRCLNCSRFIVHLQVVIRSFVQLMVVWRVCTFAPGFQVSRCFQVFSAYVQCDMAHAQE